MTEISAGEVTSAWITSMEISITALFTALGSSPKMSQLMQIRVTVTTTFSKTSDKLDFTHILAKYQDICIDSSSIKYGCSCHEMPILSQEPLRSRNNTCDNIVLYENESIYISAIVLHTCIYSFAYI